MKQCIICKQEVKDIEQGCLDSAGHITISFGYGSALDMEEYFGYIHDSCLTEDMKNSMTKTDHFPTKKYKG